MNAKKELWEKGDFTRIAESMRESGEALVGELGITEGLQPPTSASPRGRLAGLVVKEALELDAGRAAD
jgi:hypothetical protein